MRPLHFQVLHAGSCQLLTAPYLHFVLQWHWTTRTSQRMLHNSILWCYLPLLFYLMSSAQPPLSDPLLGALSDSSPLLQRLLWASFYPLWLACLICYQSVVCIRMCWLFFLRFVWINRLLSTWELEIVYISSLFALPTIIKVCVWGVFKWANEMFALISLCEG